MARGKPGKGAKKNDDDNGDANDTRRCRRRHNRHHLTTGDDDGGDDGDHDAKFRNVLLDEGRIISEMKADGNCLFRSLSDQLYDDRGARHDVVRREICDYLSKNGKEFENFLLLDDDDEDVLGMEGYVFRMRKVRVHTREGSHRNLSYCLNQNVIFSVFFSRPLLPPPPHSSTSSSSSVDEKTPRRTVSGVVTSRSSSHPGFTDEAYSYSRPSIPTARCLSRTMTTTTLTAAAAPAAARREEIA